MTVNTSADHLPLQAHHALEDAASAIASARRAAAAGRYAADTLAIEWRDFRQMEAVADAWRELAARALSPNVFYEPAFALAAAPVFGRDAGAVLVWSGTAPRRLLGFFPARIEQRRYGAKLPMLVGWTHPYAPFGAPLVDRDAAEPVVAAWLAHIAGDSRLPGLLLLPFVPEEDAFAVALAAVLRRTRMPIAGFNRHSRALLAPQGDARPDYLRQAMGTRRLKELRRLGRRLGELGALAVTVAAELPAFDLAAEDFLALEAAGWKGRAETAATQSVDLGGFVRAALHALAAERKASIGRLQVDGRAVAAAITLRSGHGAWFWKIAYDESVARFSPGVMLTAALTESLLEDAAIVQTDSCASANHPMIDHVWRERLSLCDLMIGVRPQAPFGRARRLESLRISSIGAAKTLRDWWRGSPRHRSAVRAPGLRPFSDGPQDAVM